MALTIKEVENLALLAKLNLSDEEKMMFSAQLDVFLEYADKLNQLDTAQVEPLTHILPVYNVFREDEAQPGAPREEMLANAVKTEEGHYQVPKII